MDYYKYIKYKTKYLNLKYDNNQYGGGIVPCDKGYTNALGTCWAVSIIMILCFGDFTSDQLNEKMKSFQQGVASITELKGNIEQFIKQRIIDIKSNIELTNAFAHYKIFEDDKIDFLKEILHKFIERYYNKVMNIPFIIKPLKYMLAPPEENPERCELKIALSFQNLFDFSHIKKRDSEFGEYIYGEYLFCNLLSIFLLDYKVSFTNYYDNFNTIKFDDENVLGILIHINGHVCCLFICDGEKFYNDNDKQIYNCKWKDLLQQGTAGKQLYIIKGCLKFIDDIKTYDGDIKKISKVLSLTFISKHTKEDTTLDKDIKRLLEFKKLDEIKDRNIQFLLAEYYNRIGNFAEARKLYGLSANQGYYLSQFNFGAKLYYGEGGSKDYNLARKNFKLAADQGFADAQYNVGTMSYKGEGGSKDYNLAREYFKLAAKQGDTNAQYMLGYMLYYGEGGDKNIIEARDMLELAASQNNIKAINLLEVILEDADTLFILGNDLYDDNNMLPAKKKFKLAAEKGHTDAQYKLGRMLYYGEGGEKNDDQAKNMFSLAAAQDNVDAMYMLGWMLYNGEGGEKNDDQAKKLFKSAADKGNKEAMFMLGFMLYNGEGGERNIDQAKTLLELANNRDARMLLKLISDERDSKDIADTQLKLGNYFNYIDKHQLAKKMFELAAEQGNTQAKEMLEVLHLSALGYYNLMSIK